VEREILKELPGQIVVSFLKHKIRNLRPLAECLNMFTEANMGQHFGKELKIAVKTVCCFYQDEVEKGDVRSARRFHEALEEVPSWSTWDTNMLKSLFHTSIAEAIVASERFEANPRNDHVKMLREEMKTLFTTTS
jgi:hypothetical protein